MKKKGVSLDRALSKLGLLSRSQAVQYITASRVKVDNKICTNPDKQVIPEIVKIEIDGVVQIPAANITIAFYKPTGVVTTASDEKNRKTIYNYLPSNYGKLVPVGRLDMNTSGLLLLTTNTQLANYLTDPINVIPRTYLTTVRGHFTEEQRVSCLEGIEDQGEMLKAKEVIILSSSDKESKLKLVLTQGKNREIRRMMENTMTPVISLKRIAFGKVTLELKTPGEWKILKNPIFE